MSFFDAVSPPQVSAFGFSGPDWLGYNIMRGHAKGDAQTSMDFARAERENQQAFQERMAGTAWQRAVTDIKNAGLNPMLAYSQGGAHAPPGGQGPTIMTRGVQPPGAGANMQMVTSAQVALAESQADKNRAEAENIREQTPTHDVTRKHLQQQIEESEQRISKTIIEMQELAQRASTSAAQERVLAQQATNMRETLAQIRATTRLLDAQTTQTAAMEGLSEAQTAEVRQRIKANLPKLEAAIKELENLQRTAELPRQQQDAAFYNRTAGTILRNIGLTLRNVFGRAN